MSDSDIIIRAKNLAKIYRLYSKPHYRFLDMFGLLRKPDAYTEHMALQGINLQIRRGEKVAFIGRNGAGKSTLLKLITEVIKPTSGVLEVTQGAHALLQIGAGFHPDFTGRQNAIAYLAHLGLSGKEVLRVVNEITEFAELEEYIDQPIKTYSTGMVARLMFATSTIIEPELLVLDEILGVGDAYFSQKSFERIRLLCEGHGTTLLLVTHDLYSAMQICDRFIWIERGAVLMDADAKSVIHRYEASIRDQQEARLRMQHIKTLEENRKGDVGASQHKFIFAQIRCEGNVPTDNDLPIVTISLFGPRGMLCSIKPGFADESDGVRLHLKPGDHNWGEAQSNCGMQVRPFTRHGSIYHRAPIIFDVDGLSELLEQGEIEVEVEFLDLSATPCIVEFLHGNGMTRSWAKLGNRGGGESRKNRLSLAVGTELESSKHKVNRYGTQQFVINNVEFLDSQGGSSYVFDVGDAVSIRLTYEIRDKTFHQCPTIQLNFLKDGVTRSHRFTLDNQLFAYTETSRGTLEIVADPLLLGPGSYLVNIVVMSEGGYSEGAKKAFFTANENLLDHHSRAYELTVRPSTNLLANDVVFLHKAIWKRNGVVVYEGVYPLD